MWPIELATLQNSEWPKASNQAAKICVHYQSVGSNIWAHTSNI